jgi:hypothetical protein
VRILTAINDSAFSAWIRESDSLFAYPAFITLHTLGLALVVGLSAIVAVLVLRSAPAATLAGTRPMFRVMWLGFAINALSGLVLTAADPHTMLFNPVMWTKFAFIFVAVAMLGRLQRLVIVSASALPATAPALSTKVLAAATLACWVGSIVTGRLTAYFGPVAGLIVE